MLQLELLMAIRSYLILHSKARSCHLKKSYVRQLRSAVLFWCGEYGDQVSCFILFLTRRDLNTLLQNFDPLSDLTHFTLPRGAESAKILPMAHHVILAFPLKAILLYLAPTAYSMKCTLGSKLSSNVVNLFLSLIM